MIKKFKRTKFRELEQWKQNAISEAERIKESSIWSAQAQYEQAKIHQQWNQRLGILSFSLSTFSAISIGVDLPKWTSISFAILAAALTAQITVADHAKSAKLCTITANEYINLRNRCTHFIKIIAPFHSHENTQKQLEDLLIEEEKINSSIVVVSKQAYKRGGDNIRAGGQQFKSDTKSPFKEP